MNCDTDGEIEVFGLKINLPLSRVFRHLGRNPHSGDMHYQCPSCKIALLMNPMAVLGEVTIYGNSRHPLSNLTGRGHGFSLPQ